MFIIFFKVLTQFRGRNQDHFSTMKIWPARQVLYLKKKILNTSELSKVEIFD